MKQILTLLFALLSVSALAQNDKPEREPFTLELAVDSIQYYSMEVEKTPYFVKEKVLQIYPGEKLNIECEVKGNIITTMKVVENVVLNDKTITLSFEQDKLDDGSKQMLLVVKNPFDRQLSYKAMMYTPERQKWTATSIVPVFPKISSYEMWPHPIITLVLTDWQLQ